MRNNSSKILEQIKKYRFELKHITVLFLILIFFQILISFIQKSSMKTFLDETEELYKKDAVEKIANLTSTSIELLIENSPSTNTFDEVRKRKIIETYNIIFSQQVLSQNVMEICLIINRNGKLSVIDNGESMYNLIAGIPIKDGENTDHKDAIDLYKKNIKTIKENEEIFSSHDEKYSFHILVPFVPRGEYIGAFYMKNHPDFSFITYEIISSYDEATIIYSSFILLGLIAMYYISSFTLKERNEAQQLLLKEHEANLKKQIEHEKETSFTKRIYHTHHKAEKVMGFIKEDLRRLDENNIHDIKENVKKYANFVSRVIYDMKWYDPPVSTIRSPMFNTNINNVIEFIVNNLFLRVSTRSNLYDFKLDLDEKLPMVHINEFVVWEIIEPLIQNSIDHSNEKKICITIQTKYIAERNQSQVIINDDGPGILPELLNEDETGRKNIFRENVSTKIAARGNSGYGCYISYHIATQRCGWKLDAENNTDKGCRFLITINHQV